MGICCCCGEDNPPEKQNETVLVVNDDGAITNQPTNKSANSSFRFNPSAQPNGFVNDAVEFDEIDLNERQMSVRSKERSNHNSINSRPTNNNQPTQQSQETIQVTGLMLDDLYKDDDCEEEPKQQNGDDHLSREIVEEYDIDTNVITEATDADVQQVATKLPVEENHKLTINLDDESFGSSGALTTSEVIVADPTPAPRNKSNIPPAPPLPPQWSPLENCHEEKAKPPVHETKKCPFELGLNDLEITPREPNSEASDLPTTSARTALSDPDINGQPPYPAAEDNNQGIKDEIKKNRMYGDFSSSSSDTSDEENEFELESTDRHHESKADNYSVLLNEETDKSNAG